MFLKNCAEDGLKASRNVRSITVNVINLLKYNMI